MNLASWIILGIVALVVGLAARATFKKAKRGGGCCGGCEGCEGCSGCQGQDGRWCQGAAPAHPTDADPRPQRP